MTGRLTVFVGAMGSGKTETLINDYNFLLNHGKNVAIFKPKTDTRNAEPFVRSRSGKSAPASTINSLDDIYEFEDFHHPFDVILIDEIQFFNKEDVYDSLLDFLVDGVDVMVYGLDITSEGKTFGQMGDLLAQADEVIKLESKCSRCDNPARISHYRGDDKSSEVKVGDLGDYEPLCRECFYLDEDGFEQLSTSYSEDDLIPFMFYGEGFEVELLISPEELEEAGYSIDQVKDINSIEGVRNLLIDLGLEGDESE